LLEIKWYISVSYDDDVNIMGGNVLIVRKKAEPLVAVCKDTGLQVNADRTKCMQMFRHQNAGRFLNINLRIRVPLKGWQSSKNEEER
jgi:hypothetical protein